MRRHFKYTCKRHYCALRKHHYLNLSNNSFTFFYILSILGYCKKVCTKGLLILIIIHFRIPYSLSFKQFPEDWVIEFCLIVLSLILKKSTVHIYIMVNTGANIISSSHQIIMNKRFWKKKLLKMFIYNLTISNMSI